MRIPTPATTLFAGLCLAACGADDMGGDPGGEGDACSLGTAADVETAGLWESNFGSNTLVTSEKWGDWALEQVDNEANVAVARLPDDDEYNPGKYARVTWTEPEPGAGGAF